MPTTMKTCHKQTRKEAREADMEDHGSHHPLQNQNLQGTLSMLMLRDLIPTGLPQIQDRNPDPDLDSKNILHLILRILVQNHINYQPTKHEGSRSSVNHPVPFPVSASPQHNSFPDVENKNLDGLMYSQLQDDLEFKTRSEVKKFWMITGMKEMVQF